MGFVIWLAVVIFMVISLWKVFEKAGQPGWAGIIPIYNTIRIKIVIKIIKKIIIAHRLTYIIKKIRFFKRKKYIYR